MTLRRAQGTIDVRFEKRAGVSAAWVKRILSGTLKAERSKADLNVLITDDRRIRLINKKHLKHDYATDVISFETGDLVVSADFAKRYAREHDVPYKEELARYLVHGALHLLGYDDKSERDFKRMHKRQEAILKGLL